MIKEQRLGKNVNGIAGGLIEGFIIPPFVWRNWEEAPKLRAPARRDSNRALYRLHVGSVTAWVNLLVPRDKTKHHNALRALQQTKTPALTEHIAALQRMDSSTETNFVVPRVNSEVYIPTRFAGPRCRELKLIGGSVFGALPYEGNCGYKTEQSQMHNIGKRTICAYGWHLHCRPTFPLF